MAASPKQLAFISRLAAEREMPDADRKRLLVKLGRPDAASIIGGRAVIDWLLRQPKVKANMAEGAGLRREPAALGVYEHDGEVYVVREFHPQDKPRGVRVRYARRLEGLKAHQGDRVNLEGESVRFREEKAPGMVYRLQAEEAMPMADVKAFSQLYRRCIVCGAKLEVAESIDRAMGPVCYGRQSSLLGA